MNLHVQQKSIQTIGLLFFFNSKDSISKVIRQYISSEKVDFLWLAANML